VQTPTPHAVELRNASLSYGNHTLWQGIDLTVAAGEFVAVLGPNGSGKSSLVKVLLGLTPLTSGLVHVFGEPPRRGSNTTGYVPQQKGFDRDLPIRGIDLVGLGLDGHRWGIGRPRCRRRRAVQEAIDAVGASRFAPSAIGRLSGGEQQRLRVAQALIARPRLLLCDEPLLSLDLKHQGEVVGIVDTLRRSSSLAVVFVTHEVNPILPVVDRVLYVVGSRWAVGRPAEILTSAILSDLYQTNVDVVEVGGRVVIVGAHDAPQLEHDDPQARWTRIEKAVLR
jgi:zinc/manganese transport system ATP-binding protein